MKEWLGYKCMLDQIIENFIETAAKRDINMILVPQFTPPLDTAVGGERTTLQLIDILYHRFQASVSETL